MESERAERSIDRFAQDLHFKVSCSLILIGGTTDKDTVRFLSEHFDDQYAGSHFKNEMIFMYRMQ